MSIDAKLHGLKVDEKEVTMTFKISGESKTDALEWASAVGRDLRLDITDPQLRLRLVGKD